MCALNTWYITPTGDVPHGVRRHGIVASFHTHVRARFHSLVHAAWSGRGRVSCMCTVCCASFYSSSISHPNTLYECIRLITLNDSITGCRVQWPRSAGMTHARLPLFVLHTFFRTAMCTYRIASPSTPLPPPFCVFMCMPALRLLRQRGASTN